MYPFKICEINVYVDTIYLTLLSLIWENKINQSILIKQINIIYGVLINLLNLADIRAMHGYCVYQIVLYFIRFNKFDNIDIMDKTLLI